MKKLWIGIGIVAVVALAVGLIITQTKKEPEVIKIGGNQLSNRKWRSLW